MRNLLKITAIGLVFTLFSCGGSEAPQMNTKEGLKKIKSLAIENFGKDFEVCRFDLYSQENLSSDLGKITIGYLKDDKLYERTFNEKSKYSERKLNDETLASKVFQTKRNIKDSQGKLKINDIDIDRIIANIDKALILMGEGVNKRHLRSYTIKADPKTNAVTSRFKLNVTKKGEGTTIEGRNIVTNFYEANFTADSEGNVVMTD